MILDCGVLAGQTPLIYGSEGIHYSEAFGQHGSLCRPPEYAGGVGFFDDTPERVPPRFDRPGDTDWTQPDGVIPGLTPAGLFLIRTDEVAVVVSNALAYPNGFEFTVHVRLHHEQFVWGNGPLDPGADPRTRQAPEQALRLGVMYADGRRPGPAATGRYLLMTPTASTWSSRKSAPVGASANGTASSGFIRCHRTGRSPSSRLGCGMRWPRPGQNWTARLSMRPLAAR